SKEFHEAIRRACGGELDESGEDAAESAYRLLFKGVRAAYLLGLAVGQQIGPHAFDVPPPTPAAGRPKGGAGWQGFRSTSREVRIVAATNASAAPPIVTTRSRNSVRIS